MAKRYHQSEKARVHEAVGEDMYLMRDGRGERNRRHKEMYGNGMIDEDHSAVANLPQGVKMESYNQTGPWMRDMLDDTIRGVDKQMDADDRENMRELRPRKY